MADQTIPLAHQRLAISKLLLGLFRELMHHMPEWYESAGAEAYIISSCVFMGHAEGRAMTVSDIAGYSGLPRTTVLRKLNLMMVAGIVERKDGKYCLTRRMLMRTPQVEPIHRVITLVARELSETDKL